MLFALYFKVEGATRHIIPYGWKERVATVKMWRVKRCYMTNNTFCFNKDDLKEYIIFSKTGYKEHTTFCF